MHSSTAKLFYIVGASGSGKDSMLRSFKSLPPNREHPVIVAHRYITRSDTENEQSLYLSNDEFTLREQRGCFAMSWQANGHNYGIGSEIDLWLAAGCSVIVNGSRAYLPQAQQKYGTQLHSILIKVSEQALRQRLSDRARESTEEIEARLARHRTLSDSVSCTSTIHNNQALEQATEQLTEIIFNDHVRPHETSF